jgi:hypothetical protein
LKRWKSEQDADEDAHPRDQADKGNEKHYEAERALVKAPDEPCDRYVIWRRISKQLFEHDRRGDVCAFMAGV